MTRLLIGCGGLLLAAAITFGALPPRTAAQPPAPRVKSEYKKWEYKVLTSSELEALGGKGAGPLTAGLNKLGEDGWELVAIDPGHVPPPVKLPHYVFKRPK